MDKILKRKRYIAIFILPSLLLFLFVVIVPLCITAYYSLLEYNGSGNKSFIGFANYIQLFKEDPYFMKALMNSLILLLASLFIQIPISLVLAVTLAKGIKGEKFFRTVYFIPVVISSMVIGQLWLRLFNSQYGAVNSIIRFFGYSDFEHAWISDPSTAFIATVIPAVWQYIGYHMLILYAGMKSISKDYYEAAQIDGATNLQMFRNITLPLLSPVIKTCVIFASVGALRSFDLIYVMTGGGPRHSSEVPATLMYSNLFERGQYGYGSAQAFFIVIECILLTIVINKVFKKSEDAVSAV